MAGVEAFAVVVTMLALGMPWYYYSTTKILPEGTFGVGLVSTRLNSALRLAVVFGFFALFVHLAKGIWTRNQLLVELTSKFDINADGGFSLEEMRNLVVHLRTEEDLPVVRGARNRRSTAVREGGDEFETFFTSMDEDQDGRFNSSEMEQFIDVIEDVPRFSSSGLHSLGGDDITSQFWMTIAAGVCLMFFIVLSYALSVRAWGRMHTNTACVVCVRHACVLADGCVLVCR